MSQGTVPLHPEKRKFDSNQSNSSASDDCLLTETKTSVVGNTSPIARIVSFIPRDNTSPYLFSNISLSLENLQALSVDTSKISSSLENLQALSGDTSSDRMITDSLTSTQPPENNIDTNPVIINKDYFRSQIGENRISFEGSMLNKIISVEINLRISIIPVNYTVSVEGTAMEIFYIVNEGNKDGIYDINFKWRNSVGYSKIIQKKIFIPSSNAKPRILTKGGI